MLKDNISDKNKLSRGINYFINLYNVGKKDEILSSENYILQNYSDNSILYNLIGIVAFETGNNKKAIEYFKKVLNLDPFNPHAHNNLGVALWNLKEFKKAKSVFRKAIAINPQSFEAFHNLGNIFFEEGKVLIAIDKLKKSLEINPKYERAAIKLFEILTAFNSKVAYSEFKNFLRKNPNSFMVSHMFAQFLESQDNLVEAINYYENSIKCNHNYYPSYNNLGIIFSKTNVEKAYDIFKKGLRNISLSNQNVKGLVNFYTTVGDFLFKHKDYNLARVSYNKALKIDSKNHNLLTKLVHLEKSICNWEELKNIKISLKELGIHSESISPFTMFAVEDNPRRQLMRAIRFSKYFFKKDKNFLEKKTCFKNDKLKIGYL